MKTKRLVMDAMLVALYFVFSCYLSVNLPGIRLTLDLLPVLVAAMLFGPVDGAIVGFIGNCLFQLTGPYGISVTTVLWALPEAVRGIAIGITLGKGKWQTMPMPKIMTTLIIISVVFTSLTTGVMYVDCLIFKYSFLAYSPYIIARYTAGVIIAALSSFMLLPLVRALDKTVNCAGGSDENNGN